ncbi:MAG: DUF975 family protein [Lachnospiraceae bacterium]|nr:DUF975 family protein [Lachnospiraceae bacterium]
MNKYRSSAQLKAMAKDKLDGKYSTVILAVAIINIIQFLVNTMSTPSSLFSVIMMLVTSAVISTFLGVFQTGLSFLFLNIACDAPYSTADIYYGFRNKPNRSLAVSAAIVLANLVPLLPYQIFMLLYMNTQETIWFIFTMLFLAVGLVIYVPLSLALSQSYFLLLDFPDYGAKQILQTSCKIMKGHMGRLFYIEASFLPLQLLASLSFGIGLLWVMPYMHMTYTLFFLDIMNPQR